MKISKLTEVMWINRVRVYVHWSVLAIGAVILIGALQRPAEMLTAAGAWLGVIFIHECGHMWVAQRKGYHVSAIELYPIHGYVRFQEPWSRYDESLIAWGGVAAQAAVAAPLLIWVTAFGRSQFVVVNVLIGILGYYSVAVALFNLLPIPPLDGATAWYVIPEWIKRNRRGQRKPKQLVRLK